MAEMKVLIAPTNYLASYDYVQSMFGC